MWEAIESNRRRSALIVAGLGVVLVTLGALTAGVYVPDGRGLAAGAAVALGLWGLLLAGALRHGDAVLLAGAGTRALEKEDCPRLFNVVEEMSIAAGLPNPPRVHLMESDAPNAFAVGTKPETAVLAVTSGLLRQLDRDELQGVIAHEISHLVNGDARMLTLAATLLGAIAILSDGFLRMFRVGGARRVSRKIPGNPLFLVLALIGALAAPFVARLLYFACSRRREFLADACAARWTRYPAGLANALEKISLQPKPMPEITPVLAPMFFVPPKSSFLVDPLFKTHPPSDERIRILRDMAGGAGWADYEAAFRRKAGGRCIGARSLEGSHRLVARPGNPETDPSAAAVERAREVNAILGRLGGWLALACACGMRVRIPPGETPDPLVCSRCGRMLEVPRAEVAELAAVTGALLQASAAAARAAGSEPVREAPAPRPGRGAALPPLSYTRRTRSWESFLCSCKRAVQLSPTFVADRITCHTCGRTIYIHDAPGEDAAPAHVEGRRSVS